MLTLYFAPGSSSMAVHIALHEIDVPFEGRPMSFNENDMRAPEFLALNPEGKVPVLLIDGRPLTEVAAILFYLAKWFPEAELLPRGWALGCYSIADIHLFRLYWRLANSLHPAPETFPNLTAHYQRMMARPAVQRTIEIETAIR
jgi:glutathione S-transferase